MKALTTMVAIVVFGFSTAAFAACQRDGRTYQTGDRVGPFTCMPDGSWKR